MAEPIRGRVWKFGDNISTDLLLPGRITYPVMAGQMSPKEAAPRADLSRAEADYADMLSKKPARPLAEMKARINTIARVGMPEVNAMTEGFLDRG